LPSEFSSVTRSASASLFGSRWLFVLECVFGCPCVWPLLSARARAYGLV